MDAATFRRYLQPSPTLRWHPGAPLVALVFAFVFVLAAGIMLGMKFEQRRERPAHYSPVSFDIMTEQEAKIRPSAPIIRRAQRIDNAVAQWVYDDERKSALDRLMDAIEPHFRPERVSRVNMDDVLRDSVRRAAEWRLANLSVGAPAWERTANYCDEWHYSFNPIDGYERFAQAYTTLLGRKITARQLAPAVPAGKCEAKEKP